MNMLKLNTISKEDYLANPCRAASIPYWKYKSVSVPDGMKIVHDADFNKAKAEFENYTDETYFRLKHSLDNLPSPVLPQGFSVCDASLSDFTLHINKCYEGISLSESELHSYTKRAVYSKNLWLAVKNNLCDKIAATGIAEFDCETGEGALEWIQVSREYRRHGLGSYIVSELLRRISSMEKVEGTSKFVTVSGKFSNPENPEMLYRKCGFSGNDVWHILRKR